MANKKIINSTENSENETAPVKRRERKPGQQEQNQAVLSVQDKPATDPQRKRGRPRGSIDKTERKKRSDHDIQANVGTGKNTITTHFAMAINSLPKIDINNPEQVNKRIEQYYSICSEFDLKPTVAMFACAFGITRITLFNWLNERTDTIKNRESFNLIKNAYNLIAGLYETYLNDGTMNPVSAFFLMKNNYGYRDTTDYIVTANQEQQVTLPDIINRSGLLSE